MYVIYSIAQADYLSVFVRGLKIVNYCPDVLSSFPHGVQVSTLFVMTKILSFKSRK